MTSFWQSTHLCIVNLLFVRYSLSSNYTTEGEITATGLICAAKCSESDVNVLTCDCHRKGDSNKVCLSTTLNVAVCTCRTGYQFLEDSQIACVDLNECKVNPNSCGDVCTNTVGGFSCSCFANRVPIDGKLCKDATFFEQNFSYIIGGAIGVIVLILLLGGCICLLWSKQQPAVVESLNALSIDELIKRPPVDSYEQPIVTSAGNMNKVVTNMPQAPYGFNQMQQPNLMMMQQQMATPPVMPQLMATPSVMPQPMATPSVMPQQMVTSPMMPIMPMQSVTPMGMMGSPGVPQPAQSIVGSSSAAVFGAKASIAPQASLLNRPPPLPPRY